MFCCPECVGNLDYVEGGYQCRNCSETYPIVDGLAVFSRSRDAYYGEVPKAEMQEILDRARSASWQTALLEHIDRTGSLDFSRYATDNIRSAFEFLLNAPIGNVLDFFLYRHVIDIIHFVFWGYDYPVFNVADSLIFIGTFLILFMTIREKETT